MYASKSWNSFIVGLNTGIPLVANGSSSGLIQARPLELALGDGARDEPSSAGE